MVTADQSDVIAFLEAPSTHGGATVERIDTHASIVFLTGARAWKLKRAVRYDYLDYSTLDRRHDMCEAELQINRRTAPDLYRAVVPITRTPNGGLDIGGSGVPVEWLLEMVRFDQERVLDRLASRHQLDVSAMAPLGASLAAFHSSADIHYQHGGAAGIGSVIDGNARGFAEQGVGILDARSGATLTQTQRDAAAAHADLLEARRTGGHVRRGHGDLHLRNIVMLDAGPTLFDAVEFNDDIAIIDVLYDIAFLVMDLWRRGLPDHASAVWNRYMSETLDFGGLPLMPLFMSCRAAIRAKTSATAASLDADHVRRSGLENAAREYLTLAGRLLSPSSSCIVAIGGLSGSGKSTLARALAPLLGSPPGALIVRSDEVRKQMFGIDPAAHLGPDGYTVEATARTYRHVDERAVGIARTNSIAIVDAAFLDAPRRAGVERAAAHAGIPLVGLWLEAPERQRVERVIGRDADPSDADASVARQQSQFELGAVGWHRVEASGPPASVLERALGIVRRIHPEAMAAAQA
jgi:uncharacterized protein